MDNNALLKRVDSLEKSGLAITKQWHDIFSEGMRYFFSCHDQGVRRMKWDHIVVNYVWPTAMQEIAKLSKNNAKIYVNPFEDNDIESAEVWQGSTQWQWEGPLNMRLNMIAENLCAKIFGYSVSKVMWKKNVRWDNQKKQWEGDVAYRLWHPCQFWSNSRENIQEGDCGTVRWWTLAEAKRQWPAMADALEKISTSSKTDEFKNSYGSLKFKASTSSSGTTTERDDNGVDKSSSAENLLSLIDNAFVIPEDETRYVRISETYTKDGEERHVRNEQSVPAQQLMQSGMQTDALGRVYDANSQPLTAETWPKQVVAEYDEPVYPNGRVVLSAGEGENRILLNPDEQEEIWPLERWPFVVKPHYSLPFMWQGLNAVTLYKTSQDMINTSVTHMVNNLKQFGDPSIALEADALAVNPKTKEAWSIYSAAGSVIRLARGGLKKLQIIPPAPVSPAAMAMYNVFAQEYKNLSGLQNISQGQADPGMTATQSQYLAISSNDRIALQSVFVDEWIKSIASLIAETMQLYYDEGRFIRIVGEDKVVGVKQVTSKDKSIRFDVLIEPGMTLPFDEEKQFIRYKEAYMMLQSPVANPMLPDMLRVLKIPNWKKIIDQFPAYQKYLGFVDLYNQVTTGKMDPNQAVQILVQAAQQEFAQNGPMQGEKK
jgi:hypothetical protein